MSVELALKLIKRKVQDPSYSNEDIFDLMNVVIGEIAVDVRFPHLTTFADLTLPQGGHVLPVPADYFAHPFKAFNITDGQKGRIKIWTHLSEFLEMFTDLSTNGSVQHLCVDGEKIYFQFRPHAESTIRFWYTAVPPAIRNARTRIEYIPKPLQIPLLANGVCAEIFSEIEDGESGKAPNTSKYLGKFGLAMHRLRNLLTQDERPEFVYGDDLSGELDEEVI